MFCRGIDKVKIIVAEGIINSVITFSANILFLVVFKWGLFGYLLANSIGTVISLLYCFFAAKLYKYVKFSTSAQLRSEMIRYSFPLIFGAIAWWVNHASDRYILTWIAGISASGLYAVAYKIPNLLSIVQTIFSKAWSISVIKEFDKDDSDGFISNMYNAMNFIGVAACSALMVLNIPIAGILYSKDFFQVWKFVPPLLLSVVFNAMALFIDGIFTAVKDTKTISLCTITGAAINTLGNFVLIYFFGAYGAGVATLMGFAVTFIMRLVLVKKHIRLKINRIRDISVYSLLVIQMILGIFGMKFIYVQSAIFILIVALHHSEIGGLIKKIKSK
jgi:O-antigen/teichoic acid export membrane protein